MSPRSLVPTVSTAPSRWRRGRRRGGVVLGLTVAATVLLAGPADAHVTIGADDPRQGASDSVLTFRVPNEEAGASTVRVTISFPKVTPLASVRPAAKPGWSVATTTARFATPITTDDGTLTEGVSQVVYSATGPTTGIPSGQFDTFQILVGPLPTTVDTLAFPTLQTSSDGRTVSWIQPVTDPAQEPDDPAPTLHLLPPAGTGPSGAASAAALSSAAALPSAASPQDGGARSLAVTALVVAVVAAVAGVGGIVLGRRSRGPGGTASAADPTARP